MKNENINQEWLTFGRRLDEILNETGIKAKDLAVKIHYSEQYVSQMRNGDKRIGINHAIAICEAINEMHLMIDMVFDGETSQIEYEINPAWLTDVNALKFMWMQEADDDGISYLLSTLPNYIKAEKTEADKLFKLTNTLTKSICVASGKDIRKARDRIYKMEVELWGMFFDSQQ